MPDDFEFDVFLAHGAKDNEAAREIAERLQKDGLRVWFNARAQRPKDRISDRTEYALEHSRVLVFCMSADAFGSEWARLETSTFQFRDPLNKERRFILLRLDASPLKGSLAQSLCIDWMFEDRNRIMRVF